MDRPVSSSGGSPFRHRCGDDVRRAGAQLGLVIGTHGRRRGGSIVLDPQLAVAQTYVGASWLLAELVRSSFFPSVCTARPLHGPRCRRPAPGRRPRRCR